MILTYRNKLIHVHVLFICKMKHLLDKRITSSVSSTLKDNQRLSKTMFRFTFDFRHNLLKTLLVLT